MAFRELVEADCGAANPLMRLGSHFSRDQALRDEGLGRSGAPSSSASSADDQLVNEFLGRVNTAPTSFRMDTLLQEMRDIDAHRFGRGAHLARAPPVIDEVVQQQQQQHHSAAGQWIREFPQLHQQQQPPDVQRPFPALAAPPPPPAMLMGGPALSSRDFFDAKFGPAAIPPAADGVLQHQHDHFARTEFSRYLTGLRDQQQFSQTPNAMLAREFFERQPEPEQSEAGPASASDWARDFEADKQQQQQSTDDFNSQFWNRLQSEWKKLSDDDSAAHPWLTDLNDYYHPYSAYAFEPDNPMLGLPDALQRGKQFLADGDLPSAILCFESAVQQEPNDAQIWALLGQSQAENEKDPNAIPALRKSLELQPTDNRPAMMALAISYTNESMQAQALEMLVKWLHASEQYGDLVPEALLASGQTDEAAAVGLGRGPQLAEVQNVFLQAVHRAHPSVDASIQAALGVLFNLSSEYEKAADCFRATVHMEPQNAKAWNRLGATLANGQRSVEAVEAYQEALRLEPGYIRARYNVGVVCINLKAHREAAEHFLTALNHQATSIRRSGMPTSATGSGSDGQMSDTIWSTLRMVVTLMGRTDLLPALEQRDLAALNGEFFGEASK